LLDLLELLPVQATGNENVRWFWSLLDQGLTTRCKIIFCEHCQAEAIKLLFTAPVELLIEI
jgi:hypothetical protein